LQGKFEQGASDLGRFTTNSTIGVLGLFDVATDLGLQHNEEDFGQTLAVWGVDQGPYLVLPIMGPTTVRDGAAVVVDKAANPGTYLPGTGVLEGINDRAKADGALNFIDEAALDPYVFTRESFLQYRTNLIKDGKTDADTLDLELEGDVDVGEISEVKPKDPKSSEKSKSLGKDGHVKNSVDLGTEKPNATVQAFDSMSKSFDGAEREFEAVSLKMDEYSKKKRRWKRR
jgi:phospholipid-binding lipoprotein MlaA